ncbi:glycosyltransferase involved in cell wall biosynthesis [Deinococcus metalli]|uniref:Glycosyltransferase involved in cell wall biosynthesis n=1 Tax=Deinococcus metalli TaxID=1141878 RepID=A0A7W8NPH9_9DEIO|nr:glycosyltransferase [Deinococcus metalli]MBB5375770.1 glycosyltransferase involved in cell wall biosynthesis [Deinococcus metalli]GHF37181.1 hypothetical protein GCM10017781_12320 [Deinococcus metalli]
MKTAYVHDWLAGGYAGAEKVLEQMLDVLPGTPVYTMVHEPRDFIGTPLEHADVRASLIQKLPMGRQKYRAYLPLMPFAVEQFDLTAFDVIVSSSYAVAKGVLVSGEQLHLSYVHSPVRYAWDLYQQYLREANLTAGAKAALAKLALHYLRLWDLGTANRVDVYVANSEYVARRIWRTYRRPARVLYPPVEVKRFDPSLPRENFYLTMSRFVPYKKLDLIVRTFSQLDKPLVVIGSGPDFEKVRALAGTSVTFLGRQPDEVVADHMNRCRAFVFAADEDFGIVSVEAQAAGAPVIAYGRGGSLETVVHGVTGLHFQNQTVEDLAAAVLDFERSSTHFSAAAIRRHAERFSTERFKRQYREILDTAVAARRAGQDPERAVLALPTWS